MWAFVQPVEHSVVQRRRRKYRPGLDRASQGLQGWAQGQHTSSARSSRLFFKAKNTYTDRPRSRDVLSDVRVHTACVCTWGSIRHENCERALSPCPAPNFSVAYFNRLFLTKTLFVARGRPRRLFPASAGAEARGFFLENTRLSLCGFFEEGLFCEVVS